MSKFNLLFILMFVSMVADGQAFQDLVQKAWNKDKMLKEKEFKLQSAQLALEEAKSLYYPTISFGVQYTLAAGGRNISLPVGDLLNPVYNTLNDLTQSNQFRNIPNSEVNFLPNNFYDARFRVQQAIYYPDLKINKLVKMESYKLNELEIKAYKRILSKEVINAYFQKLMTGEIIKIYEQSHALLLEAKRTTNSMVINGIALPSSLARIEAQMANLNAQKIDAGYQKKNAQALMFFLTGDSTYQEIEIDYSQLPLTDVNTTNKREELLQLEVGQNIKSLVVEKEQQFFLPRIGTQIDLGSQAFNFGWEPYVLLGVNIDLNLYDHGRHKTREKTAMADLQAHQMQMQQVEAQLELQTKISFNNLLSAIEQAQTHAVNIESSKKSYRDVYLKYKEGLANYIELLDAQTQVTNSEIQYALAKLNAWLKWSEHIYNTATLSIP